MVGARTIDALKFNKVNGLNVEGGCYRGGINEKKVIICKLRRTHRLWRINTKLETEE